MTDEHCNHLHLIDVFAVIFFARRIQPVYSILGAEQISRHSHRKFEGDIVPTRVAVLYWLELERRTRWYYDLDTVHLVIVVRQLER
jgi:hypothetical protein